MAKDKPLTRTDLISALKEIEVATKDDLKEFAKKDDLKVFATKEDLKREILASERRLILRLGKVRNDLADRIARLALTTPTLRQFDELKQKVEARYN